MAVRTKRQRDRGDAIPRPTPDMAASPWPGRGGGPGGLPGFPDTGGIPRAAAYALAPPNLAQPPGATTIRVQGRNNAQVIGDGEVEVGSLQIQAGELAIIRIVNIAVINLLNTSEILFRVKTGGQTVDGWTIQPFAAPVSVYQQEFPPESTFIEIPEAVKIGLTVEVMDAGTYDVDFMVQGWKYGRELRDDFVKAWRAGVV